MVLFNIINLTAEEGGEVESLLKEGCWSASHPVCRVRGAVRIKNHKKNKKKLHCSGISKKGLF